MGAWAWADRVKVIVKSIGIKECVLAVIVGALIDGLKKFVLEYHFLKQEF
jgi:hypothetical protein